MKKIKILVVIGTLNYSNGITNYAINYYKNIDKTKFEIDFAVHHDVKNEFYNYIKQCGNNVYLLDNISIGKMHKIYKNVKKIMLEKKYDIIHCHLLNISFLYFFAAKKYNVKVRIIHSHATKYAEKKIRAIRNMLLGKIGLLLSNKKFSCSNLAGKFLYKQKKYVLVNNAIELKKYKFNEKKRKEIRKKYNVNDEVIIGHIGRFSEQKNHRFLIELLEKLNIRYPNKYKMMLIGDGHLYDEIINNAKQKNVYDNIIFIKNINNTCDYYNAFDIFVLPSFFEGLPVVGIEAQANGLPCIFSNAITNEVKINENVIFLPINDTKEWSNIIEENRYKRCVKLSNKIIDDYDIEVQAKKLEEEYKKSFIQQMNKIRLPIFLSKTRFKLIEKIETKKIKEKRCKKLINNNFSIISNNCYAGWVYRNFNLPYKTPTVGLFIMPDDYIKLINNLKYYFLECDLKFIDCNNSKYKDYLKYKDERFGSYPIGLLDDIEIHFLHYANEKEAKEKWNRRCKRVNWDNLILKFDDQNLCTFDNLKDFSRIKTSAKKICFVANQENKLDKDFIYVKEFKKDSYMIDDTWYNNKYVDLIKFLNRKGE